MVQDPGDDPHDTLSKFDAVPAIVHGCNARLGGVLSTDQLAETTQEVCAIVLSKRPEFRGDSSFETWVYGVARLAILRMRSRDCARRSREAPWSDDVPEPEAEGPSPGTAADVDLRVCIEQGLRSQGSTVLEIAFAHEVDGQTFAQIGRRLHRSEAAVKARYYRALPALRMRLAGLWKDMAR